MSQIRMCHKQMMDIFHFILSFIQRKTPSISYNVLQMRVLMMDI